VSTNNSHLSSQTKENILVATHSNKKAATVSKAILIDQSNREVIQANLDRIQGHGYADILTIKHLIGLAEDAESALAEAEIAASYRSGARYEFSPSGPTANSYKYSRLGTAVVLERRKRGWFLIDLARISVWPRQKGKTNLVLADEQKRLVLLRVMSFYKIYLKDVRQIFGVPAANDEVMAAETNSIEPPSNDKGPSQEPL
jgi:hypothetical protein